MHTADGLNWINMHIGPELGSTVGNADELFSRIRNYDTDDPLYGELTTNQRWKLGPTTWHTGPHNQFGITAAIFEGSANTLFTVEENLNSGSILARALVEHYGTSKPESFESP